MSSNLQIARVCEHCKVQFVARTTRTRYCSHNCNRKAYKMQLSVGKIEKSNAETIDQITNVDALINVREYLNVGQVSHLVGISRRTVYRLIDRGELNIAKFGTRTVVRRCDLEAFFNVPIVEATLQPVQHFPGVEHCYSIGQIQKKFKISSAALYHLLQRHGVNKYTIGKMTYVSKSDIDTLLKPLA